METRKKRLYQKVLLTKAYKDKVAEASPHRTIDFSNGKNSPYRLPYPHTNREVATPIGKPLIFESQNQEEDFSLDKGILSHFFKKELEPNSGNAGRTYLQGALEKQKNFEKVFLKLVIEGEKEKLVRLDRRSKSVNRKK